MRRGLLAVLLRVVLTGLRGVMGRVLSVSVRRMRMMGRLLVIAALVMLGGFAMMAGGVFMMVSSVGVVLCTLVLCGHGSLSSYYDWISHRFEWRSGRTTFCAM